MTEDSPSYQPADPKRMHPRDALEFAIGRYVRQFANLETIVGTHVSYVLELDHNLVFFILKEMFFDQKVKLLRRSAVQKFGENKSAEYISVLNKISKAGEFRNALLHGAFSQEGENHETQLRGKLGQSLTNFDEGFEETGYSEVEGQTQSVDALAAALIAAFPDCDSKPSSSSNLEQSGSGDQ